jgi:hypothetical protein
MPDETDPPLIVDPDRALSLPIRFLGFEPIARGNAKIGDYPSLVQKTKFSECDILNIGRQSSASLARPDQFCLPIGEALNHA